MSFVELDVGIGFQLSNFFTVSSKSFFVKVLRVDAGSHFHFLDLFGCIGPF